MNDTRKFAVILVSDVVGYSRLAGVDEDRTLARQRGLRSDLIDPAIEATRRCVRPFRSAYRSRSARSRLRRRAR